MLIYVNITDGQRGRQLYQKYCSEPHKIKNMVNLDIVK